MPRFVILKHDHPVLHWDFLLEDGGSLKSWRLAAPLVPGVPIEARRIANHRIHYLDYEGPVSGNRGQVVRWDWGTFSGEIGNAQTGTLILRGQCTVGVLRLEWISGDAWEMWLMAEGESSEKGRVADSATASEPPSASDDEQG